jgi:hypothetical protein
MDVFDFVVANKQKITSWEMRGSRVRVDTRFPVHFTIVMGGDSPDDVMTFEFKVNQTDEVKAFIRWLLWWEQGFELDSDKLGKGLLG